ncbi:MAG: Tripartite ATP-independent periplasmic transporter [Syntrophorhabdus sp. PtaU1.Bin058]|nr:MAG: Tripartite ATP-independent periplasmic transporter [Syntrophorhabdus sp. PtaU1.Bin058]
MSGSSRLERFEKLIKDVSGYFEWVGVAGILMMFFANLADVIGAKFFRSPLPGALEVISFMQVVAITPAIAFGLFLGSHLEIDFIVEKFPKTLKTILSLLVSALCFILFVFVFWQGLEYGYSLQKSGEIGSVSKLPLFPFAYLFSVSCLPVIFFYVIKLMKTLKVKR